MALLPISRILPPAILEELICFCSMQAAAGGRSTFVLGLIPTESSSYATCHVLPRTIPYPWFLLSLPCLQAGSEAAEPFHDVGHSEFALEQWHGFEPKRHQLHETCRGKVALFAPHFALESRVIFLQRDELSICWTTCADSKQKPRLHGLPPAFFALFQPDCRGSFEKEEIYHTVSLSWAVLVQQSLFLIFPRIQKRAVGILQNAKTQGAIAVEKDTATRSADLKSHRHAKPLSLRVVFRNSWHFQVMSRIFTKEDPYNAHGLARQLCTVRRLAKGPKSYCRIAKWAWLRCTKCSASQFYRCTSIGFLFGFARTPAYGDVMTHVANSLTNWTCCSMQEIAKDKARSRRQTLTMQGFVRTCGLWNFDCNKQSLCMIPIQFCLNVYFCNIMENNDKFAMF